MGRAAGHREPTGRLPGSSVMRIPALSILPMLLLAACGSKEQNQSGGIVTNILDQALPDTKAPPPAANSITPVEPPPALPVPRGEAERSDAIPIALQGSWTGTRERCGDRAAVLELRITAASLVFHESVGTVRRVTRGADGRLTVEAAFTGEGDSWNRTLTLRPSADGRQLTIVNDGEAVVRKRCA